MLVNKRIKELTGFVATKDDNRSQLTMINVSKDELTATDGHMLVNMPVDKELDDEQYPAGTSIDPGIDKPVMIDTESINKAVANLPKKANLPILNNIQIGTADNKNIINSGLPVITFPCQDTSGLQYPDYKQVIPDYTEQRPIKFALNGAFLKKVCDLAIKHGDKGNKQITFEIPTASEQVKLDENGEAVFYDAGTPVYELQPITTLTSGLKFEVRNDDDVMFTGLIMPLRIKE